MSEDVILVSSDDELESPPAKKTKVTSIEKDVLAQLNKLKEITAAHCEGNNVKTVIKKSHIQEEITIIIEGDEKCKENGNGFVNLIDEEITTDSKDLNSSSDIMIIGSDSDSEDHSKNCKENLTCKKLVKEQNLQEESSYKANEIKIESQSEIKTEENCSEGETKEVRSEKGTEEDRSERGTEEDQNENQSQENHNENIVEEKCNDFKAEESKDKMKTGGNHKEVKAEIDIFNRPSTSTASDAHKLLDEFLEICAKSTKGSKYESKVLAAFPKMRNKFNKCDSLHQEANFKRMLQEYIGTATISAPEAVVSFQRIHSYLLDYINGASVEVNAEELLKLRKLEKTCKVLIKKLAILEAAEINFDDEEDSVYVQIDRYSHRLTKVYNKYCQLLKKSPHSGRLLYEKLQFVHSRYNEINRAITKSYKNNKFPTYYDIEKCIQKCVAKHNLGLSDTEIKEESKNCFTKMGNLLQSRRKRELYEVHCSFIALNEDPANTDENLKQRLQDSLQEGERKMKDVVEKYVKMQENNANMEVSEDSDDSNYKNSDSETDA